ncbi:MAG: helix-turn-helix transcriptional regulator [Hyphomicrobiales bacterium]|nr:helix-turn-helix transcriptional regulator [Hyphomicrobiales bacterium]
MDRGFERLVARVYDAALEEDGWPRVVTDLIGRTESAAGGLLRHAMGGPLCRPHFHHGIAPRFVDDYVTHFRYRIPWVGNPSFYRPGQVRTDRTVDQFFNDSNAFHSTEYYNDWMRPQGLGHIMRTVLRRDEEGCVSLFLFRRTDRGAYGSQDTGLFKRLVPHLMRAGEIRRRFERADLRSARDSHAADCLSMGVVHLDHKGRLQTANGFAERLLQRADALSCRGGRLMPVAPADRSRFDDALRAALTTDDGTGLHKLSLARAQGGSPLAVTLVPVTRDSVVFDETQASLVLLIADPEARAAMSTEMLVAAYGLTRSEARLAALLTEGGSLREAAAAAGITYETARSYLKTIFQKTGTGRQADLVRLLLATGA